MKLGAFFVALASAQYNPTTAAPTTALDQSDYCKVCSPHADCYLNKFGKASCKCKAAYEGDGYVCYGIPQTTQVSNQGPNVDDQYTQPDNQSTQPDVQTTVADNQSAQPTQASDQEPQDSYQT